MGIICCPQTLPKAFAGEHEAWVLPSKASNPVEEAKPRGRKRWRVSGNTLTMVSVLGLGEGHKFEI